MQLLLVGVLIATAGTQRFVKDDRLTTVPDVATREKSYDTAVRKVTRGPLGHVVPMSGLTFGRFDALSTGFVGYSRSF